MPRGAPCLLLLVACAPSLNPWGFREGKRLSPQGFRAQGGATYTTGIRDRDLGPCAFDRLPDGRYACLPAALATYADEGCQTPVYLDDGCADPPPLAVLRSVEEDPCHDPARITSLELRPIGDEIPVPSPTFERAGGECRVVARGGKRAFSLGAPVPDTRLVHATIRSERRGDLFVDYYAASDGSSWLIGARDPAWGYCRFNAFVGGDLDAVLCGPARAAIANSLSGRAYAEGCGGALLAAIESPSPLQCTPTVAEAISPHGCATLVPHTYYSLGALVDWADVRAVDEHDCFDTATRGLEFHRLGDEISSSHFVQALVRNAGEGVAVQQVQTQNGELLANLDRFVDGDHFCQPKLFADGRTRCVETGASFLRQSYADAACTERLAFAYAGDCAAPPTTAIELAPSGDTCSPEVVRRVFALHDAFAGPVYQNFGGCVAAETLASHYYRVGEDITAALPELDVLE